MDLYTIIDGFNKLKYDSCVVRGLGGRDNHMDNNTIIDGFTKLKSDR